ncbi:MAG: UDP-N-acetylmuramate dehydrogenase [Clostridia bacterium]|nr:UDP-N-acetylmuramate dehydrogenase [Clostridia bacterium]
MKKKIEAAGIHVTEHESMAKHTTLHLGGPADLFCQPQTEDQIQFLLKLCTQEGIEPVIIGHGSNLLVLDGGIRGIVIQCAVTSVELEDNRLTAGAGVMLHALARRAAEESLSGLEFASGIPGTLGGAVYMNAGAYGGEMADVIESIRALTMQGDVCTLNRSELAFRYRYSALQERPLVMTQAVCVLKKGDRQTIAGYMEELQQKRTEKQPLQYPSAGSTFKRPEGAFAAKLIDDCGLRGTWVGGAQVSEKHAGFLLNRGGTSADFLALMELVRERVRSETGIVLEPEVRILGTSLAGQ